jgi:purine nucleosidase
MQGKKIIIDVDTGIDDALALVFASKTIKERVIGITTCGGNVPVEEATANTLKVLELLEWDVPVYSGASRPTNGAEYTFAYDYHGSNGICDVDLPLTRCAESDSAVKFIADSVKKFPDEIDVVCLAAPTNIAKAIKESSDIGGKINSVYMMGGALNVPGNQTEYAEYNFFQDPEAVEIVLSGVKNIFVVPLDVTNSCFIEESDLLDTDSSNKVFNFFKEAVTNWYGFFGRPKKRRFELYDPLAVSALTHDFLGFKKEKIEINTSDSRRGQILVDGKHKVNIAYKVDAVGFKNVFLSLTRSV